MTAEQRAEETVSDIIKQLSHKSRTPGHELVEECLDYYGLYGTIELSLEQAREFLRIVIQREEAMKKAWK